jgi:3-deoxy-manno-octulosonate cytidylyltransferase (CMP-KDO synthetase)
MRVLGVIPARLASTRLPRKVLRDLAGRPLIAHTYAAARRSELLADVLVATDADEVFTACRALDIPCVLTSAEHPCGTDRVWEVSRRHPADVYVNVQGDEPFVTRGHIERLVRPFQAAADTQVSTLKIRATPAEVTSPHSPKVVTDIRGRALYFSRHPIPYDRDGRGGILHFKHLGLYAYTGAALDVFHGSPEGVLEQIERLEQLRFLERGIPITVTETDEPTIGIDTEDDLRAAHARLMEDPEPPPVRAPEASGPGA